MASLAWQPLFFMASLFAASILCQLLVAACGLIWAAGFMAAELAL